MQIFISINANSDDGASILFDRLKEAWLNGETNKNLEIEEGCKGYIKVLEDHEEPCTEQPVSVQDHPDFPEVIDAIEKYGDSTKDELVTMSYDDSGEGLSKTELRAMPKAKLLALLIDSLFGATCQ